MSRMSSKCHQKNTSNQAFCCIFKLHEPAVFNSYQNFLRNDVAFCSLLETKFLRLPKIDQKPTICVSATRNPGVGRVSPLLCFFFFCFATHWKTASFNLFLLLFSRFWKQLISLLLWGIDILKVWVPLPEKRLKKSYEAQFGVAFGLCLFLF